MKKLEDNFSTAINQLNSIINPIPQALQPTHVEDVENTIIIHESNKPVRFKLDY